MKFLVLIFIVCFLEYSEGKSNENIFPECGKIDSPTINSESEYATYPWNVGIFKKNPGNDTYSVVCGGTIIHPMFVVTAAQCLVDQITKQVNKDEFMIAGGKVSRSFDKDEPNQQTVKLQKVIVYENYEGFDSSYAGDIALLKVKQPFNVTSHVTPICIDQAISNPNEVATMVGWTIPRKEAFKENLQEVNQSIISYADCKVRYFVEGMENFITSDKLCAVNIEDKDIFINTGSGVIFEVNGKYYLQGLISTSPPKQRLITGLTSTTYYFHWILASYLENFQKETLNRVEESAVRRYPWHVGIFKKLKNSTYLNICGGTIINQRIVITAAHCLVDNNTKKVNINDFMIAAGKVKKNWESEEPSKQTVKIAEVVVYENYAGIVSSTAGDIAIVKVDPPFEVTSQVSKVHLDRKIKNPWNEGIMIGWIIPSKEESSENLKKVDVSIISNTECLRNYKKIEYFITSDKICSLTKLNNEDLPISSGSGVVIESDGKYYLQGIVSTKPPGAKSVTGLTSTLYYFDWIQLVSKGLH